MRMPFHVHCSNPWLEVPGREDQVTRRLEVTGKKMFTTEEAATICRLPHQVIMRCLFNGKLRGTRVSGPHTSIPRKELARFVKLCGFR